MQLLSLILLYTAAGIIKYLLSTPCSDGVGHSGTFCALKVNIDWFKAEQMVYVFKTIITMREQRPRLVANAVRLHS